LEPPHNVHLNRRKNVVKCRIDLYKVPPKCVNFDPTRTHLYVDTLKFTKKYRLKVPYPEGVEVNPDVEALFDSGVITVELPIVSDPNKPTDYDDMIKAREEVKELHNQGLQVPEKLKLKAKMKERKEKKEEAPAVVFPTDSTGKKSSKSAAKASATSKKPIAKPSKKTGAKSPKDQSSEPKKRTREAEGEEEEGKSKKSKKTKVESEPKEPKKKTFLDDTKTVLQVADAVNDMQEKQIQERLDREYAKLSYETRKKIETREKKIRMKEIREMEANKAFAKGPKKEKFQKKSATKVSFDL